MLVLAIAFALLGLACLFVLVWPGLLEALGYGERSAALFLVIFNSFVMAALSLKLSNLYRQPPDVDA